MTLLIYKWTRKYSLPIKVVTCIQNKHSNIKHRTLLCSKSKSIQTISVFALLFIRQFLNVLFTDFFILLNRILIITYLMIVF